MSPCFDESALIRLRAGRTEAFLDRVIDLFLREAPARLEEAWLAGRRGDARGAARAVHVLGCLAGNVGALEVRRLAEAAESAAAGSHSAQIRSGFPETGHGPDPREGRETLSSLLYDLEIALAEARACLPGSRPGPLP